MAKQKRFNGKPMSHWEHEAKKLVVEMLVRASMLDERSIIGKIAHERLVALAKAEDPAIYEEVLEDRLHCQIGMANVLNDITGGKKIKAPKRKTKVK